VNAIQASLSLCASHLHALINDSLGRDLSGLLDSQLPNAGCNPLPG
jgi:hypothetical protein